MVFRSNPALDHWRNSKKRLVRGKVNMKKNHLLALALSSLMVLSGCGATTSSSAASSGSASSAETSSTATSSTSSTASSSSSAVSSSSVVSSSSKAAEKLATPVLALNETKTGLTWAAVSHASKYQIKVNTGAY